MGQAESDNKNKFNGSFPDNYIETESEEYSLNEHQNNGIKYEYLRRRLSKDTFMQTHIKESTIIIQTFKRKTEKLLKEKNERAEREKKEKEEMERIEREIKEKRKKKE